MFTHVLVDCVRGDWLDEADFGWKAQLTTQLRVIGRIGQRGWR